MFFIQFAASKQPFTATPNDAGLCDSDWGRGCWGTTAGTREGPQKTPEANTGIKNISVSDTAGTKNILVPNTAQIKNSLASDKN